MNKEKGEILAENDVSDALKTAHFYQNNYQSPYQNNYQRHYHKCVSRQESMIYKDVCLYTEEDKCYLIIIRQDLTAWMAEVGEFKPLKPENSELKINTSRLVE